MAVFKMSSARGIQMMYIYLTTKLLRYPSLAVKLSSSKISLSVYFTLKIDLF